jgi:hypothetical protein
MPTGTGRLAQRVRGLREHSLAELGTLFAPWVRLRDDFGSPKRRRLFSPLTDLLALSLPGPLRGRLLPGRRPQVPRLARRQGQGHRLAEHGGVLQGTGPSA